jgi:hypothetical protein
VVLAANRVNLRVRHFLVYDRRDMRLIPFHSIGDETAVKSNTRVAFDSDEEFVSAAVQNNGLDAAVCEN